MVRSFARVLSAVLGMAILLVVAFVWHVRHFAARPVIDRAVYRSSQPSAGQIAEAVANDGIRSVINLRGRNERDVWYTEETRACAAAGIAHYDIPFETFDWPPRIETRQMVEAFGSAPRPMLLHCESGIDRSGWASAVALLTAGRPLSKARHQLSIRYGHICRRGCRLDQFFDLYEKWLSATRTAESSAAFERWARTVYCPEPYDAAISATPDTLLQVAASAPIRFDVTVRNDSRSHWIAATFSGRGIRLGARILGPYETWPPDPIAVFRVPHVAAVDAFRDSTIREVKPGDSYSVETGLTAPAKPGLYLVQFDMVDEMVHWFSDLGEAGAIRRIEVR